MQLGDSRRLLLRALVVLAAVVVFATPRQALAADDNLSTCDGPSECCPARIDLTASGSHLVAIGVVITGIYEVNEKASSWTADYYLYERWTPAPGFTPQTEIANEIERKSAEFETTELRSGACLRTRRLHSLLRTDFNLRMFPFDRQTLTLQVSDAEFPSAQARYEKAPNAGIDEAVLHHLTSWRVGPELEYARAQRSFQWDPGAPDYDYATFSIKVSRHVTYHLGKFFLPLLLIVVVSFSVFWIDPEDLSSETAVSVTCLLAAVALQLVEAGELPDVDYLTLADRAFSTSYVAIALSVLQSVYANYLVRSGQKAKALRLDRRCRVLFPVGLVVALVMGTLRASAAS